MLLSEHPRCVAPGSFYSPVPRLDSRRESKKTTRERWPRTHSLGQTESTAETWGAQLTRDCKNGQPRFSSLLQRVQRAVRAADEDDVIRNQRGREDGAHAELPVGRDNGRFTPVRPEQQRDVEFPIRRQHPTVVALRRVGLEFPQELTAIEVASFERAVEDADEDDVSGHRRRREDECLALLLNKRLAGFGVDHQVEARVRSSEEHLAPGDRWRADHPASAAVVS